MSNGKAMKDLTSGNIAKNLILFMIPVLIGDILNKTHTLVDKIMVGQYLGEVGLAAIGSTGTFNTVITALFWGLGTGIGLYIGKIYSSSSPQKIYRAVSSNLAFAFIIGAILSALSIILYRPLFSLLSIDKSIYAHSFIYFAIIFGAKPLLIFSSCANGVFYILGKPSIVMRLSIINCLTNIAFNFIFLQIIPLGVLGAAIGTAISILLVSVLSFATITKQLKTIYPQKEKFKLYKEELFGAWRLALPCFLQQGVMYVSSFAVQPAVNALDNASIAAYAVCVELYDFSTVFFNSSSKGLTSFCTQCYGNGKVRLIKRGLLYTLRQSLIISSPIIIISLIFPNAISSLFVNDKNSQMVELVSTFIMINFPFLVFAIMNNIFHNFYRGVMSPKLATITTAIYTITRIATTYSMVGAFKMNGVFYSFAISWGVELVSCLIIFLSNKWKTKDYKQMEKTPVNSNE